MTEGAGARERTAAREITVEQVAWVAFGALFIGLRAAGVFSIPVGGVELDHLSGAWQAHAGNQDARFVPTLFQAVTAWSFAATDSELPARLLALAASASVPIALYRLRGLVGEAGALSALLFLAIDPVSILLGTTAWAGAFDIAIVLWLLVSLEREMWPPWLGAIAGFVLATAGSAVLPLVISVVGVRLLRQQYPGRREAAWGAGGILVGAIVAASSFGFGLRDPVFPPLAVFAQGFEREWASETTAYLALLYSAPLLVFGMAAAGFRLYLGWRDREWDAATVRLLVWLGISLAWILVAGGANDPVPLAAAAVPAALLAGRELPLVIGLWQRVNWSYAAPALAGLLLAALVAEAFVVDWARIDRVGRDREQLIVTGLVIAALACAGILASNRETWAALFVPGGVVAAVVMLSGASAVAFGGQNEPLPSPISSVQGREVRDIALQARREKGGTIVLHPDFKEAATWPFRDSGEIVFAFPVPQDAVAVVWPLAEPAPEGFAVVSGNWSLREHRDAPDGGFLAYLRWLTNRNSLQNTIDPVAVYLRTAP